ncbi:hypothetical protein F383_06695 [Gossypium arboreum]|uniref:Uncharacterized protein n=1 Tax=Gossypium arboreum TaxID=29729 RepID=A0A0B0NYU1_GOSAR|nr:hypothetical protein F383_06695 [Gossypium arboreum]
MVYPSNFLFNLNRDNFSTYHYQSCNSCNFMPSINTIIMHS